MRTEHYGAFSVIVYFFALRVTPESSMAFVQMNVLKPPPPVACNLPL